MAYDEVLGARVRALLGKTPGVEERKMFGGLCFMVNGNMACGITQEDLMVRVGPEAYEASLARPEAREMDFTGRSLRGMVYVATDSIAADFDLAEWVERGADFACSLPAK
jgi:TfoX/Sxy family transcriptional regulator of competence genes